MSKKCRIREFLKPQIPIFPDRLGSWKIEAVLENQYRKWGFHQNLAKSVFDESLTVPIKGRAAESFKAYLDGAGITEGPIFRSVLRSGELQDKGISPQMVNLILKERLRQAGYDAREYGAHSLRAGFLMEGGKQRMALSDLMAMSGHRTASHAIRYHRAGAAMDNPAALMAG